MLSFWVHDSDNGPTKLYNIENFHHIERETSMLNRFWLSGLLAGVIVAVVGLATAQSVLACGGFFCVDTPVDQNAERIIFTQNRDGTVSAYVQIEYTGSAPDFSWILPLPEAIDASDIEVPEDAMAAFSELEVATDPVFIPPPLPECVINAPIMMAAMAATGLSRGLCQRRGRTVRIRRGGLG